MLKQSYLQRHGMDTSARTTCRASAVHQRPHKLIKLGQDLNDAKRDECLLCSWRLVEAAQGISNALPKDTSVLGGLNEATYLAQQAKAHNLNIMRLFGIADVNYNEGMPLQSSPGAHANRLQGMLSSRQSTVYQAHAPASGSPGPRISPATHAGPCSAFEVTDQGAEEAIIQSSASLRLQFP